MKPGYKRVPEKEQEEFGEKAVELSQKLVRAMVICTCAAYERLYEFQSILDQLEDLSTPLGKKFITRVMPIVTRNQDTLEAFSKDMMLAARDVVQEHFNES